MLDEFEKRVEQKYLRKCVLDNLVLYKYTEHCVFEKAWDKYTRMARGIILDRNTGELVAHPFPKFFNLNEMPETSYNELCRIQDEGYEVYDKLDGSLGITYIHNGKVNIATVGSFHSEQAIEATNMLNELHPEFCEYIKINERVTFLFEIIYPSNKIVCDYKGERKLVLLSAFFYKDYLFFGIPESELKKSLKSNELSRELLYELSQLYNIPIVEKLDHTIQEMIELQKTLPKDKEGFVVRFSNGLRVKIKGDEYLRIHKLVSICSPLAVWENMVYGKIKEEVRMSIPEEYIKPFEDIEKQLSEKYERVELEIYREIEEHFPKFDPLTERTSAERKEIGLYIKNNSDKLKHPACIFPVFLGRTEGVDKYIMDSIRPDANRMEDE
jgi:RNA ligase